MKIKSLFQSIDAPPHGLEKLQQALRPEQMASEHMAPAPALTVKNWYWQAATVLLVGGLWVGLSEVPDLAQPMVALQVPSVETEIIKQSALVTLPSTDPQVKMYWVMSEG